jgi:hypothetical protein
LFIIVGFKPNQKTRSVQTLEENWQFINAEVSGAEFPEGLLMYPLPPHLPEVTET